MRRARESHRRRVAKQGPCPQARVQRSAGKDNNGSTNGSEGVHEGSMQGQRAGTTTQHPDGSICFAFNIVVDSA